MRGLIAIVVLLSVSLHCQGGNWGKSKDKIDKEVVSEQVAKEAYGDTISLLRSEVGRIRCDSVKVASHLNNLRDANNRLGQEVQRLRVDNAVFRSKSDSVMEETERMALVRANYVTRLPYKKEEVDRAIVACEKVSMNKNKKHRDGFLSLLRRYGGYYEEVKRLMDELQNDPNRENPRMRKAFIKQSRDKLMQTMYYKERMKGGRHPYYSKLLDTAITVAIQTLDIFEPGDVRLFLDFTSIIKMLEAE